MSETLQKHFLNICSNLKGASKLEAEITSIQSTYSAPKSICLSVIPSLLGVVIKLGSHEKSNCDLMLYLMEQNLTQEIIWQYYANFGLTHFLASL